MAAHHSPPCNQCSGPTECILPWQIYAVFESIKPDYHIDLHTFSTLSIPFIFLDRSVRSPLSVFLFCCVECIVLCVVCCVVHMALASFPRLRYPRVLYDGEAQKEEAHKLFAKTKEMVTALGLSVLVERPAR